MIDYAASGTHFAHIIYTHLRLGGGRRAQDFRRHVLIGQPLYTYGVSGSWG